MYIHYIYIQPSNVISYKYIYIYIIIIYIIDIWVFPKIMAPPNDPFVHRVFHYVHHLFWGFSPYFWFNTHIHRYPQIILFVGPRLDVDDMTNSRLNDITQFYLVVFHPPIWFNICCARQIGSISPRIRVNIKNTPQKFNMESENDGFQKESPFPGANFQVPC